MTEPGRAAGRPGLGELAVLAAAVAFGTTGTARAQGPSGTTSLGVGALRVLVGAAGLVAYLLWRRWRLQRAAADGPVIALWPRGAQWTAVVAGSFGVALYQPMFFAGTERSGVAVGTIVALGSGPAFVGAWEAVVVRRRPSTVWVVATALALVGGGLLVSVQADGAGGGFDGVGVLCSLAAGLGYAIYAIAAKHLIAPDRGVAVASATAMTWIFAGGALLLAPALLVEPIGWVTSMRGGSMIAHLGLVTVTIAYLLYGFGLRTLPTSTAVTLTLAEPVTAALAGVVVLGERLDPVGWLGAGLVVAGLALTGLQHKRA